MPSRGKLPEHWRLGLAGVLAIGVTFGFARYGYGLFLPDIRREFGLSMSLVGLIASASYIGYLVALTLVGVLAPRVGPRPLVVCGGLAAATGMALVAVADAVTPLVAGLVLAGTSSGWAWAPYSDAADRLLPPERRDGVLALLPSGTAFATAVAGPLALLAAGSAWRGAWIAFTAAALVATAYNARVLPAGPPPRATTGGHGRQQGMGWLVRRTALPLYLTAASYGLAGAVYWAFAVDAITGATGADATTAPLFWTLMGVAGTSGVLTGRLTARLGLRRTHTLLIGALAVAVALLGAAPGTPAAIGVSAVLYGSSFMAGSGLLAVWSYRVFPERPSTGFSATVFFLGLGTVIGPAVMGVVAEGRGLRAAFALTAVVLTLTLAARPHRVGPAAFRGLAPGELTGGGSGLCHQTPGRPR